MWLLRPLSARTAAAPRVRLGLHEVRRRGTDRSRVRRCRGTRTRTRCASDSIVQRAGWQASVWGSYARRVGWRPWGLAGAGLAGRGRVRSTARPRRLHALRRERAPLAGAVAARDHEDRSGGDGGARSRSLQPVRVRHVRQPAARLSFRAGPLRPRRRRCARRSRGRRPRRSGWTSSPIRQRSTIPDLVPGFATTPDSARPWRRRRRSARWSPSSGDSASRGSTPRGGGEHTSCESLATKSFDGGIMRGRTRGEPCDAPSAPPRLCLAAAF